MRNAHELIEGLLEIARKYAKAYPNGFTAAQFANDTGVRLDISEHNGWFQGTILRRLRDDGFLEKTGHYYYLRKKD